MSSAATESSIAMSTACPRPVRSRASSASGDALRREHAADTMSAMATPRRNGGPSAAPVMLIRPPSRLHDGVVAGFAAPRAGLAEAGDRAVDQPRMLRPRATRSRARASPACPGRKFSTSTSLLAISRSSMRAPFGLLEVERDAFLVAIDAQEVGALAFDETAGPSRGCRRLCPAARS